MEKQVFKHLHGKWLELSCWCNSLKGKYQTFFHYKLMNLIWWKKDKVDKNKISTVEPQNSLALCSILLYGWLALILVCVLSIMRTALVIVYMMQHSHRSCVYFQGDNIITSLPFLHQLYEAARPAYKNWTQNCDFRRKRLSTLSYRL